MNKDLQSILAGWRFDPSSVNARWIMGGDGRPRVQLRLDLGVLQMEPAGRPDGTRPKGYPSLLEFYLHREEETARGAAPLVLGDAECQELQQEAAQYYYRYLALYALRDLDRVIEDTDHNLSIINLVERYADDEDLAWQFAQFFPYVRMMHARASAERSVEHKDFDGAIASAESGVNDIRSFWDDYGDEEDVEESREIDVLLHLRDEILGLRPKTEVDRVRDELDEAVASEDFERAARLRDKLRALKPSE
jgi:hypothetical protein